MKNLKKSIPILEVKNTDGTIEGAECDFDELLLKAVTKMVCILPGTMCTSIHNIMHTDHNRLVMYMSILLANFHHHTLVYTKLRLQSYGILNYHFSLHIVFYMQLDLRLGS